MNWNDRNERKEFKARIKEIFANDKDFNVITGIKSFVHRYKGDNIAPELLERFHNRRNTLNGILPDYIQTGQGYATERVQHSIDCYDKAIQYIVSMELENATSMPKNQINEVNSIEI